MVRNSHGAPDATSACNAGADGPAEKLRLARRSLNPVRSVSTANELLRISTAPDPIERLAFALVVTAAVLGLVVGFATTFDFSRHSPEFAALVQRFIA